MINPFSEGLHHLWFMQTRTTHILSALFSALLLFLFLYTAASKLLDHDRFVRILHKSPLLTAVAVPLSWFIPFAELMICGLLFIPALRVMGFRFSFMLMSVFTLYIGYMLLFTPDLPCSCGGVLKEMSWGQHLVFNLFFVIISLWGKKLEKKNLLLQ